MWGLVVGCAPPEPEVLVAPDDARDGLDGTDGPFGALRATLRLPARVTDVVEVDVVWPGDGRGEPAVDDAPAVVLVPGGFVDADRYAWLAAHLATRGYVVASPRPALGLALLEAGDTEVARRALDELSQDLAPDVYRGGPVVAAGHSLGGVVAGNWFVNTPDLAGVVLLASWPTARPGPSEGRRALALVGSRDGSAPPATVAEGLQGYGAPLRFGVVDGMTHYAWTDDPTPGELGREPAPARPVEALRRDADRVIDAFLDAATTGGEFPTGGFPNVDWR